MAPMATNDTLLGPVEGAQRSETNGVVVDVVPAGEARVKRVVYPAGYRWSTHIKPAVGTELCMHAHVGFLVRGRMAGEYADGCGFELTPPAALIAASGCRPRPGTREAEAIPRQALTVSSTACRSERT